jgi:GT2 family glycosyltransferase
MDESSIDIVISDNDPTQNYKPLPNIPMFIKVFRTGGGVGFSQGNNMAVSSELNDNHDSVLLLNNDTVVSRGAINLLRNALFQKKVGAVGPCMPYLSNPEKIWACGGYIRKIKLSVGGLQPKSRSTYDVDYLPGAAIMCLPEIWRETNGLSEKYFLAFEEAEFALEIKNMGFRVIVEPRAVVFHKVGMSSKETPAYFYNGIRNRLKFSKYIYGNYFGIVYGILITATAIKSKTYNSFRKRFCLWRHAVADEIKCRPLNRSSLQAIEKIYTL